MSCALMRSMLPGIRQFSPIWAPHNIRCKTNTRGATAFINCALPPPLLSFLRLHSSPYVARPMSH